MVFWRCFLVLLAGLNRLCSCRLLFTLRLLIAHAAAAMLEVGMQALRLDAYNVHGDQIRVRSLVVTGNFCKLKENLFVHWWTMLDLETISHSAPQEEKLSACLRGF
eukprot:2580604-Amphidinium_carterae.2